MYLVTYRKYYKIIVKRQNKDLKYISRRLSYMLRVTLNYKNYD